MTSLKNTQNHVSLISNPELKSEEVQEIIAAVPSWILRRGILIIFLIISSILVTSAFIQYPDVVKSALKISSLNAPKLVYAKQTGKITTLLVREGEKVRQGSLLAFMESTANHRDVLRLHKSLKGISDSLNSSGFAPMIKLNQLNLGELQLSYQNFHQQYLQFLSSQDGGYYLDRKSYLEEDLTEIHHLRGQIIIQQEIQKREYKNITQEFEGYKTLYKNGVISQSEYTQQENKYLSGSYPIQQSAIALLNNKSTYASKQKEILELEHIILDEKSKFIQSLSNMITETDAWMNKYILRADVSGIINYAGIIQENQTVAANQEIFMVNPANTDFFGEIQIPQYNMGKVKLGQQTLIKMHSYPFEEFGIIRGKISSISDAAFRDSIFIAKVKFVRYENKDPNRKMILKNGMQADAEIITEESSLLQRLARNFVKMMKSK